MVLYPIPVFLALAGFLFILFSRVDFFKEMRTSGSILLVGAIVYGIRLYRNPTRQSQTATRERSPTEI
jgi:hypothetical protein